VCPPKTLDLFYKGIVLIEVVSRFGAKTMPIIFLPSFHIYLYVMNKVSETKISLFLLKAVIYLLCTFQPKYFISIRNTSSPVLSFDNRNKFSQLVERFFILVVMSTKILGTLSSHNQESH
jgi:hypothetical protein